MKLRIIAVLTALTSFATMFAGCGKETPPCAEHVDANNDKVCDGCKRAIIKVVEELPYEEPVVEMVVKTAPTDAVLTDYVVSTPEEDEDVVMGTNVEEFVAPTGSMLGSKNSRYYYLKDVVMDDTKSPVAYTDNYVVFDAATGKNLFEAKVEYDTTTEYEKDVYGVSFTDYYYLVTKAGLMQVEEDGYLDYEYVTTYTYYTYEGKKIYETQETMTNFALKGSVAYAYFEKTTVAVNAETFEVMETGDKNTFVERPTFNYETENYGVCKVDGKLLVYDLSKWIDCVYAYSLPTANTNTSIWVMAEDKMLIQSYESLSSTAINFDVEESGQKYDIHYTVIDLATKTATEQEFGYVIQDVVLEMEGMTELAKNTVIANEIVDKKEDSNKQRVFVVDEKLDILFAYNPLHIAQNGYKLTPVGNNLFVVELKFADNTTVKAVMDKDGTLKNYMPRTYTVKFGMLRIDEVFHDYTLAKVFDYKTKGYTLYAEQDDFMIFTKTEETEVLGETITTYYYYNGEGEPVAIDGAVSKVGSYGFVTTKQKEDTTFVYTLYNKNSVKVSDFDSNIYSVACADEETGVFMVVTDDDKVYAVR